MAKHVTILLFIMIPFLTAKAQERLELLETNIQKDVINNYADSYLWTKNWWLTSGMLVDTNRGGNTTSKNSPLTKQKIDSLHQLFTKLISPDLIRFGKLVPRIVYNLNQKTKPYIISSIYEIKEGKAKPLVQFKIEFDKKKHNNMPDIYSISISSPDQIKPHTDSIINSLYRRKPTAAENNITPPEIAQNIE